MKKISLLSAPRCRLLSLVGLLVLLLFPLRAAAQHADALDSLMARMKAVVDFDYRYPREKVYLHLDNNAYLEGDTLWAKAYVVRAGGGKPEPVSRVLYVELLNDLGQIVMRQTWEVDSLGQADGCFRLEPPVTSGYYEVRAYTREMVNWGPYACFSRVVPVFAIDRKDNVTIDEPRQHLDFGPKRRPEMQESQQAGFVRIDFYPEGGCMAAGLPSDVAFRIADARGRAQDGEITVYAKDGTKLATSATDQGGLGTFHIAKATDGMYACLGTGGKKFKLPAPQDSLILSLHCFREDGELVVRIQPRRDGQEKVVGMAVICREDVVHFDTLHLLSSATEFVFPEEHLGDGVNRLVLFTPDGRAHASRLLWRTPRPEALGSITVRQNKATYDPFEPIALTFDLRDSSGSPVQTTFSVAVRDLGGDLVDDPQADIAADFLLASEVRGFIANPRQYFTASSSDAAQKARALDLLLLTQGWEASAFDVMCGRDSFALIQPIETALTLNGHVYKDNNRHIPLPGLKLKIQMYTLEGGNLVGETVTDADGRFALAAGPGYDGDWIAQFTVCDSTEHRRWSRVAIDRWFDPIPRRWSPAEIQPHAPYVPSAAAEVYAPDVFEWQDTIPRYLESTQLGEATVVRNSKYRGFTGNRYTWNGGERAGKRRAEVFYDFQTEIERYKDAGFAPGTALEFLAMLDEGMQYENQGDPDDYATGSASVNVGMLQDAELGSEEASTQLNDVIKDFKERLQFHGKPAYVYWNNGDMPAVDSEEPAEWISSVAVMRASSSAARLIGKQGGMVGSGYIIIFYELPNAHRYAGAKGIERRRVQGFTLPTAFRAPSYNGLDLPKRTDRRRTLHWAPRVRTDSGGRASVILYNNATKDTRIRVSAAAVASDGTPLGL